MGAPSTSGGQSYAAAAGGAAAVELQPVAFDLVLGSRPEFPNQVANRALVQILDVAAGDADNVVMMAAAADAVVQAAVLKEDAADDVQFREKAHGTEYGGAAHAAGLVHDLLN